MKLNNKGWSLNTLLICMAIILSFLLISVLYVYKLSNEFTSNLTGVNNSTNYSNNNSSEISDSINNNNNTLKVLIDNDLISAVIGLIILVIIFEITYAIFRIVFTAFETIEKNINSFDNKQRWKKRGGHKKK